MIIRSERSGDIEAIYLVHKLSFPTIAQAQLVNRLRVAEHLAVSLVAEANGLVVGHIAFSPVAAAGNAVGVGLAPLAVWDLYRHRGFGSRLVKEGLQSCRAAGFGWAVVLGHPHYYRRVGFRAAANLGLHDDFGGGSAFQVVELINGALPVGAGLVKYVSEFYDPQPEA